MGSFYETCRVSNLSITDGDKVRLFYIAGRPAKDSSCEVTDSYKFYGLPPLVSYADYGRYELIEGDEESAGRVREILHYLKQSAVPMEVGENVYHDIAVDPSTLSFESMNEAVWEGRLFVNALFCGQSDTKQTDRVYVWPVLESVYQDMLKLNLGTEYQTEEVMDVEWNFRKVKERMSKGFTERFYALTHFNGPEFKQDVEIVKGKPVYKFDDEELRKYSDLHFFCQILQRTGRMLQPHRISNQDVAHDLHGQVMSICRKALTKQKKKFSE